MKREVKYITTQRMTDIHPSDFGLNLFVLVCIIAFIVYHTMS